MAVVQVRAADPLGAPALQLLAEAVVEARERYPEFFVAAAPPPRNAPLVPGAAFALAFVGDAVVGCAALRPLDDHCAELRRIFVRCDWRRRGVARALLAYLLREAAQIGYHSVRLETGIRQPEAIALYSACGFRRIAPFGAYVDDPTSICFERAVPPSADGDAAASPASPGRD